MIRSLKNPLLTLRVTENSRVHVGLGDRPSLRRHADTQKTDAKGGEISWVKCSAVIRIAAFVY